MLNPRNLTTIRSWFRPRIGQSSRLPIVLVLLLLLVFTYINTRTMDMGVHRTSMTVYNAEPLPIPVRVVTIFWYEPWSGVFSEFTIEPNQQQAVNIDVPNNRVAWFEGRVRVVTTYTSQVHYGYCYDLYLFQLFLLNWTMQLQNPGMCL